MERYAKVPVLRSKVCDGVYRAWIVVDNHFVVCQGSTEEEAFTNLLDKLGYEEAK